MCYTRKSQVSTYEGKGAFAVINTQATGQQKLEDMLSKGLERHLVA